MDVTGDKDARTRRRFGPRAAVLAVFCALLAAELGLRAAGYGGRVLAVRDPELGWVHLGAQEKLVDGVLVRTNSMGYRDDEWAPPAEEGHSVHDGGCAGLRVAVLGASNSHAGRIPEDERWTERLQGLLADRLGEPVLVMNFGVPGYTLEQMAAVYRRHAASWRPDLVLVELTDASARPRLPVGGGPLRRYLVRTALYDFWHAEIVGVGGVGRPAARTAQEQEFYERADRAVREPFVPENAELWEAARGTLGELGAAVEAEGGRLVLMALPGFVGLLDPERMRVGRFLADWAEARGLPLHDPYDAFLAAMAPLIGQVRSQGLNPRRVWQRRAHVRAQAEIVGAERSLFFFDDPDHWTADGHGLLAQTLAGYLEEAGLVGQR